jgi:hypothetical protein
MHEKCVICVAVTNLKMVQLQLAQQFEDTALHQCLLLQGTPF